ncbi:hypothetical protein [Anatilimnocola floriformis]|uniref:hypothetical protein n=1 Tax=Anatilimnocola floriformis TaxID=2948575 RepID=UPI0020C50C82|nr:hypothetical protein [Anatilimnocola floriformis]
MHPREAELRSQFRAAVKAAEVQLQIEASPAGYLELYEFGLITSGEVLNFVWRGLADDATKRTAVLLELQNHADDSIRARAGQFLKMG